MRRSMLERRSILARRTVLAASALIVAVIVALCGVAGSTAKAEDKRIVVARNEGFHPLRPLFRLFGAKRRDRSGASRKTKRSRGTARRHQQRPARQHKPAPVAVPKDPDANVVLVVGDSLARGLGKGLEVAFADSPKVQIRSWVNGSSGLVRDDYFNWPTELRQFFAGDERVDAIVVMVGVNDRQRIRDADGSHQLRTEEWEKRYRARVVDMLKAFAASGKPVIWVGLPPTRSSKFSADMAHFNDVYKAEAELSGVVFVDIWQRFVDEEGRYTRTGPDVEGQTTILRAGDGIHFTGSGYRKLAFYVEKELRRVLETGAGGVFLPGLNADGTVGPKIGAVLPLTGPTARVGEPLAGEETPLAPKEDSLQNKVIVRGEPLPPETGRVDDFGWPRR